MPSLECPECGTELEIGHDKSGNRIRCPECDHLFLARIQSKKPSRRDREEDDPLPQKPKKNGFAIASMCCGIVSVVSACGAVGMAIFGVACMTFCCCPLPYLASYGGIGLGAVLGSIGLTLGILGLKLPDGKGMAWAGIATSAAAILISLVLVVLNLVGAVVLNTMPPPAVATFPAINIQPPATKAPPTRPAPATRPGKRP